MVRLRHITINKPTFTDALQWYITISTYSLQNCQKTDQKYTRLEEFSAQKSIFRFSQLLFSEKCIQKFSVLAHKTCSYFFCLKEHIKAEEMTLRFF